jgi:hypothetical protein
MHQVFRITKSTSAKEQARDLMAGVGTVVQVMTTDDGATFLQKAQQLLLPPIKDPAFACFPFYVPLLERKSLEIATVAQLESWFCGASVYMRESPEDKAFLLASSRPIALILDAIGAQFEAAGQRT